MLILRHSESSVAEHIPVETDPLDEVLVVLVLVLELELDTAELLVEDLDDEELVVDLDDEELVWAWA